MKKNSLKVLSCLTAATMLLESSPKSFAMNTNSTENAKDLSSFSVLSLKALTAGNYVRSIKDLVQIVGFISYVAPSIKGAVSRQLIKFSNVFNTDFIDVGMELDKKFHDEIKGQVIAKEKIKGYIHNFLEYIVTQNRNCKSESEASPSIRKRGHILYLIGESGTGKSKCAETIAKVLLEDQSNIKVIDASSVDSKHKESFKDQLFRVMDVSHYEGGQSRGDNLKSNNLGSFIYGHPKSVVIINEYDKICEKELDETLRTIVDSGIINTSSGQVLDCDEVFFIITSNEGKECFPSLFPENAKVVDAQDEKTDKENTGNKSEESNENEENDQPEFEENESNENSKKNEKIDEEKAEDKSKEANEEKEKKEKKNDESARDKFGKTKTEHDVSFASRLFVVPFERLNKEDMKEVAKSFFENKFNDYKKQFGINFVSKGDFFKEIAEYAENSPLGARIIVDRLDNTLSLAISTVSDKGCSGSFEIEFVLNNGEPSFKLTRLYKKEEISKIIEDAEKFLQEKNKIDCLSDYVFDNDEEAIIDFKSYLNATEIENLKKLVEETKKINSEQSLKEQENSINEIQRLMSMAYTRFRRDEKIKKQNTPWYSRVISWIGDKAAAIVDQGK